MRIFAYLDPASGGLIVQAVLGGIAGVAVAARAYGRRFLRRSSKEQPEASADAQATAPQPESGDIRSR